MIKAPHMYTMKTEAMEPQNGMGIMLDNQDHLRKMFIGGLSAITTEDSLRAFFSQFGEVVDAIVMRDPATKRSRGFGFISFSDISAVDKAMDKNARPHIIDGKTVDSKRALPRPESGKGEAGSSVKKIFVGGLKENHDENNLTEHFSQFGNVVSVKILTDKNTGRKRGFAFVEFDDYDAVDKAVLHKNHTINFVLVDVKKSMYKQELAKKLSQQQNGGVMAGGGMQVMGQPAIAGAYQPQVATYAPQPGAYAYSPAMAPAAAAAPAWGAYMPSYQQPIATGYATYGAPAQNGAAAWNATAYAPAPQTWQNGYGAPAAAAAPATLTAVSPAQGAAWNGATATPVAQTFGDYQQSYNGGPQKAGTLQGNRMNPYQVSPATASYDLPTF